MGDLGEKIEGTESKGNGSCEGERSETSSSSGFLLSSRQESHSTSSSEESSSASSTFWNIQKDERPHFSKEAAGEKIEVAEKALEEKGSSASEIETMMKERLSKLLLGEDMSGCGNGVCTALAISNAITNLCATLFGQLWRLEPVPPQKKAMWRREMEWLLCVSDHIVELVSSSETFSDGNKLEVMTSSPRPDLYINLPALHKLDNMLLEILDSFQNTEFWYVDQGILAMEADMGSSSFRHALQRQEEKWWLPVPQVPTGGLSDDSRKILRNRRDCANQIFKAATAINTITIDDMEFPEPYLESLPKNARSCLGDIIYRYITSDQFYPECLLDCLDLSSEHQAIEISNRVEASIFVWRKRGNPKPRSKSNSKSSWDLVKELVIDADKRELLADRAESLLHSLKQRFPGLPQTNLDMSKIQFNKDVGKAILESYSRVLESLAFNIVARIDDVLYVDDFSQSSDELLSLKGVQVPCTVPASSTPYKTAFATPSFSPAHIFSSAKGQRSPFVVTSGKTPHRGSGVKKVLNSYLGSIDSSDKELDSSCHKIKVIEEASGGRSRTGSPENSAEDFVGQITEGLFAKE